MSIAWPRAGGRVLACALACAATAACFAASPAPAAAADDAVQGRVLSELSSFTGWLSANGVKGYIGEVGWPDDSAGDGAEWNAVAERWYQAADAADLWATAWAAGEWWGTGYPLAAYEDRAAPAGVDAADSQAAVIEAHPTTAAGMYRGVNVAGGEFGTPVDQATSTFSNVSPGLFEQAYHYDAAATFTYLASRGIRLVRIPFRWERLQPSLNQSLDQTQVQRLKDVVARAGAAGLKVVLDMHNYGAYYLYDGLTGRRRAIGSAQVPNSAYADVWRRLSIHFKDNPAVFAYGLMNEPIGMDTATAPGARVWESASQAAVDAIRATGDKTYVRVAGYFWSGVVTWAQQHPRAWIRDPLGYVRYEAHHYFDGDHSGRYTRSYDAELADARARGY